LHYRIDVEARNGTVPVNETSILSESAFSKLGEACQTYEEEGITYLVGQCSQNYVWYSGKLWRVVLKNNETGSVKMVTDNSLTSISYHSSIDTATYETSYIDEWLRQEFLPTLHDYSNYLIENASWSLTSEENMEETINDSAERTVALLTAWEYNTILSNFNDLATKETLYLNNHAEWWTLTKKSDSFFISIDGTGTLKVYGPTNTKGVRPSVQLKSNIQVTGLGTISDPYRFVGDFKEVVPGSTLLSTCYSGEYVKLNQELYRIVGVENQLTKVVAVDKPEELANKSFDTDSKVVDFRNAVIKSDLEDYYQQLDSNSKNMIEPNTNWYINSVSSARYYKQSICATADSNVDVASCEKTTNVAIANIGLPRYGEMFASQITRKEKSTFWLLTLYTNNYVFGVGVDNNLSRNSSTNPYGARPSMYLKSNVVIASTNTGDGTYEHPYDIELGS